MQKTVTVIIPCWNEKTSIGQCLDSIVDNGYPLELLEILVVDGLSDDGTREIIHEHGQTHRCIHLVDNPKRHIPSALNIGIRQSQSDIIIRLDGHSILEKDYISNCIDLLTDHDAANVGGIIKTIPRRHTLMARMIAYSISHPFGVGLSHFRLAKKGPIRPVDTVPFGCFKRELFSEIGYFDENLPNTEDIDFNLRIKKAGKKIILSPHIVSYYYARGTLKEFVKHNYRNGFLVTAPLRFNKVNFSARHLIPIVSLFTLCGMLLVGLYYKIAWWLLEALIGCYVLLDLYFSFKAFRRMKSLGFLVFMPFMFPLLHLSYGLGSLLGLFPVVWTKLTGKRKPANGSIRASQ